jgi:integrase
MQGHVTKKGKSWNIVIYLGIDELTGKKKYKWFGGYKTKKEAQKDLPSMLTKFENDDFIMPDDLKVSEYLTDWLDTYGKEHLARTTFENYRMNVEKHIIPYLGSIKLQELKPMHISKFLTIMTREGRHDKKGGLSKGTVLKIHKILTRALNNAVKLQMLEKNPAVYVDAPKIDNAATNVLSLDEIHKFFEIIEDTPMEVPCKLAIGLGLRRGEIFGLKWEDIDFDNSTITIKRTLARITGEIFFKEPKTQKSRRTLILPQDLIDMLRKHRKKQLEYKLLLGREYNENNLICCKTTGEPINPNTFSGAFRDFLRRYDLPIVRFHDLRHTFATVLMANNISPKIASSVLGHTNISTTMDLYSHVLVDMKKDVADTIGDVIFKRKIK